MSETELKEDIIDAPAAVFLISLLNLSPARRGIPLFSLSLRLMSHHRVRILREGRLPLPAQVSR